MTPSGVYFCPSYMVGSGRAFSREGFLAKINTITHFIVCDIALFPRIPYFQIVASDIKDWWIGEMLSSTTRISRIRFLNLIRRIFY